MRVNVETRGITKAKQLARILEITHYDALGRLVHLWAMSQDQEQVECLGSEICFYFDENGNLDNGQVLDALVFCGFIKRCANAKDLPKRYEIRGNKRHVEFLASRRLAAKRGGERSWEVRKNKGVSKQVLQHNSSYAEPNAIQCNTKHTLGSIPTSSVQYDFEKIYQEYPRRDGSQKKKTALARLSKQIKTEEDYKKLLEATRAYAAHCNLTGKTGTSYVQQFATFVNDWQEWLDKAKETADQEKRRYV